MQIVRLVWRTTLFSSFPYSMGVSMKLDFDCDTIISKMFRIYFTLCFLTSICLSCRLLVPSELLNGYLIY